MSSKIKNLLLVIVGTLVLAFGTAVFVIPFDLVIGGVSSFAILAVELMHLPAGATEILITVFTWGLFLLGAVFLGKGFALKTLVSSAVYPIGIALFSLLVDPNVFGGIFCLAESEHGEISLLLAALMGGLLTGTGCAITFLGNGSTGGVDILAFIICKAIKKLKSSWVIFVLDATAVILGLLVFRDLVLCLLGLCAVFVGAIAIDKLFVGESGAFMAQIVSKQYRRINEQVCTVLERSSSIVEVEGGYTGEKKKMLMVTFSRREYRDLMDIIHREDKNAFVTIHRAHSINGEGWE